MPKELSAPEGRPHSRRSFLVKLVLGAAAVAGASVPLSRLAAGGRGSRPSHDFPGPDSIFHPAQDPRQDPRRPDRS